MPNKDGVVSIGFDYKKELEEACSMIEKELNNIGGDVNLSEGLKKQIKELKTALESLQKDFSTSFEKIGKSKLDTKTFSDFEKKINKQLSSIKKEIGNLKSQLGSIDSAVGIENISNQLDNLDSSAKKATKAVSDLIDQAKANTKQETFIDTTSTVKGLQEVKKLLADVSKEDFDFGHGSKSAADLTKSLDGLIDKYYKIESEIDELSFSMQNIDKGTQAYKEQELQLSKMRLELGKCALEMDDILGATNSEKINWSKTFLNEDDLFDLVDNALKSLKGFKAEAQNIIDSIKPSISKSIENNSKQNSGKYDVTSGKVSIPVELSTKQSTINKQLDEMIANLQERAAKTPIIAPVKLRVDSEYEKSEKDTDAPAITQNQIDEARKSTEGVIPGLEKAFNNSMRIATNKAVETAKESIKSVREFFETNPITVHLTVPDDEKVKIGKAILSEDGKTTVDISGQVDKARKSVKGLSEDLEKSQLLIKENAQNAKNLSLEKLVNSLSDALNQFSEIKSVVTSIQNMESTMAMTSGISSATELKEQWELVEKAIINATKLDGSFRKNANINKVLSEYQKYINMGGNNSLFNIDKIKDNQETLAKLYQESKDFSKQSLENDSIKKLSVDLDGVIAKFDELISTVKTATNALYKIIKVGNVSDIDKQWASISDKFKSIADESGKINLNKQKKDVQELIEMYQKYESIGGTNSLANITDNVETLRKLDNEYKKLNQTKEVDNSANIKKESSSFNEVEKSVESLTTAIGDKKVQAINTEATAMEDAAEREILAVRGILDNIDLIVDRLNNIKGIKLPKFNIGNIDKVQDALESLNGLSGNKSNISTPIKDVIQGEDKSVDSSAIASYSSVLDQLSKSLQEINSLTNVTEIFKGLKVTEKQISNLTLLQKSLEAINESLKKIDANSFSGNFLNQITELTKQADALKDLASILKSSDSKIKETSDSMRSKDQQTESQRLVEENIRLNRAYYESKAKEDKEYEKLHAKYLAEGKKQEEKYYSDLAKMEQKRADDYLKNLEASEKRTKDFKESMQKDLGRFDDSYSGFSKKPVEKDQSTEYKKLLSGYAKAIDEVKAKYDELSKKSLIKDDDIEDFNKLKNKADDCAKSLKNISSASKGSSELSRNKLLDKVGKYLKDNTRMSKGFRQELEALQNKLKNLGSDADVSSLANDFLDLKNRIREAGQEGKSFADILSNKSLYNRAAQFAGYYLSLTDFVRYGKQAIDTIIELDTALIDLKKTTAMSSSEMENFYFDANDVAKEMGVTTSAIIDQASAWSRLGYNTKEASTKMAKLSSKFATISPGMETEQAQEGLVSIMKAWDIDVDEVESEVINKINILGNSFAEENQDLVEGMKRSAAALASTGTTYQDAFALFTGAQEVLQNSEVAGRALRSISMRIHGYSENSEDGLLELDEELTNITGDLIDLTKTAEHTQGVSIFKDGSTTEFKSLVDYFGEINEIWDEMSQKQQNDFLQKAFGKTQAQAGAAIIKNYESVVGALEKMEQSAGSADAEMAAVESSISFKLNALKETWVGTVQEMIDRGDVGTIIDGLTKLSEAIGFVVDKAGFLGTIGAGAGIFAGIKNVGINMLVAC